jgi:hypothetical protein
LKHFGVILTLGVAGVIYFASPLHDWASSVPLEQAPSQALQSVDRHAATAGQCVVALIGRARDRLAPEPESLPNEVAATVEEPVTGDAPEPSPAPRASASVLFPPPGQ